MPGLLCNSDESRQLTVTHEEKHMGQRKINTMRKTGAIARAQM